MIAVALIVLVPAGLLLGLVIGRLTSCGGEQIHAGDPDPYALDQNLRIVRGEYPSNDR